MTQSFGFFSFDIFLLPSAFRLCVAPYKDSWGASICQQRPRVYFYSTQTMGVLTMGVLCKGIFSSVSKLNQQIINSICTIQIDNDQYVQGGGKKLHGKQHWKHWKLLHRLLERGQFHHWPAQKGQHQPKRSEHPRRLGKAILEQQLLAVDVQPKELFSIYLLLAPFNETLPVALYPIAPWYCTKMPIIKADLHCKCNLSAL